MNTAIVHDCYRAGGDGKGVSRRIIHRDNGLRYLYFWRKIKESKNLVTKQYYRYRLRREAVRYGIEIPLSVEIDYGMLMLHASQITVNSKTKIGKNFTILKGATIGNIKGGKKEGSPIIGDNVYIGLNAVVVGGITIGNDVLIAANSFVNFDVPDHSIVIGNPGIIHQKDNATEGYIVNPIIFEKENTEVWKND